MNKQDFINAGFNVIDGVNYESPLLKFIQENYPQIIRDNEIKLDELKSSLGLPVDEKVNGYGLNFIGRNVAKGKYRQDTDKVLKINTQFSRDFENTQNLVLKGDNLDCLKILKSYYSRKIKCIYIDPPYNTEKDEFVYPDKFDKEEAEGLGLAGLTESDMDRLEFSFKTKKSHNGWLTFIYPRLMIARDLLSSEGVIFISIDDNEQANLKLLMDEVFGEENFVGEIILQTATDNNPTQINTEHEYIICYAKCKVNQSDWFAKNSAAELIIEEYQKLKSKYGDDIETIQSALRTWIKKNEKKLPRVTHYDNVDSRGVFHDGDIANTKFGGYNYIVLHPITNKPCKVPDKGFRFPQSTMEKMILNDDIVFGEDETTLIKPKKRIEDAKDMLRTIIYEDGRSSTKVVDTLLGRGIFDNPKSHIIIKRLIDFCTDNSKDIVLDFFAGSGTTAHSVMLLNAEDGGSRKFILCQIDEPIKDNKPAYKFCIENGLPPFISSITCERIRRAGDKIRKEIEEKNTKAGMFSEDKQQIPDIGFKVFDLTDSPKLAVADNGQVSLFDNTELTPLDRIYNLIFKIGIDNPTTVPSEIVKDCMYNHGSNYYITNSIELDKPENRDLFKFALQNGRVYIDGWTATLNTTLQETKDKEDRGKISIVF